MTQDLGAEDQRDIAARFSRLMRLVTHDGDAERPPEIRDGLVDRLRDALDRQLPHFPAEDAAFVAGSFVIEASVHRGATTEVSRLRHRDLGSLHAMKTVAADHADDAVARALLLREARIGLDFRHPHLIHTQTALRLGDGRPAIVTEWAGGGSLSQRLVHGAILPFAGVLKTMSGLLGGLAAMHEADYVHCDIAPGNLFFADNGFGHLQIGDFGVALERGGRHREFDIETAMTPAFAPREQAAGEPAEPAWDLYAAGCIMSVLIERCSGPEGAIGQLRDIATRLRGGSLSTALPSAAAALELLEHVRQQP
jgi:type VI secretion system protein ImpN